MILHTDDLTCDDLYAAVRDTGLAGDGVWLAICEPRGSRKRDHAFDVYLTGEKGRDRNGRKRRPASRAGFYREMGATYDEWGIWMAELFARDPRAVFAGAYDGVDQFNERTKNRFVREGVS